MIKSSAERAFFLKDIAEMCAYYFEDPSLGCEEFKMLLDTKIKAKDLDLASRCESFKELKSPPLLRLIVTGVPVGPPVQEIMEILGEEICQKRFEKFKSIYLK